ncbi:hypothetical protein NCCP2222_19280 [Sporosarcina sp. NCCP-2222]|uniref:phage portal protein n=1 Tax=Sporosarcina sp. NCCP-2222 TaxID=2935073 RepID=UPI00207D942B|nr:phage portal protein [Sporosarcina sp. NCCP-2222]GKV55981.1 hypothetical protein NCCP2222_19280 [Sporosarcina sp. NCCP-2222]
MGWFRNMVMKMLKIQPATESKPIVIREPLSYGTSVLRNRLWYRGDPSELDQFYKQTATDAVAKSRFWAAVPSEDLAIRKIHSGLPAMIVERLSDIVVADMDGIALKTDAENELWNEINKDNDFDELVGESITDALIAGDGAFKITIDTAVTKYPIIEFFSGEQVDYKRTRNRLQEILFYTEYTHKEKDYRLEEAFGRGYINFCLFDAEGREVPLTSIPQTAELKDVKFSGDFIMAVPLYFFKSPKWKGRGKSVFESKADSFDALDEVISQWVDAIRSGRVQKYIPDDLLPKDPHDGSLLKPNPFDNQFIRVGSSLKEDDKNEMKMVQPAILYEAFVSTYASALDMCLQGIISPATLGIDLKKTDNAEAQREKEKATLYTRGKIIDTLNDVIPQVVATVMKVYDTMLNRTAGEYDVSVTFGEYASPSFDAVVETVMKARGGAPVMSTEQAVEELYGDTWTDEEKAAEVQRIKAEEGVTRMDEPQVGEYDDPPGDGDE